MKRKKNILNFKNIKCRTDICLIFRINFKKSLKKIITLAKHSLNNFSKQKLKTVFLQFVFVI